MLDRLERATVGENFSRSTLEMVSLAAAEEQQQCAAARPIRPAPCRHRGAGGGGGVAVGLCRRPSDLARPQPAIAPGFADPGKLRHVRARGVRSQFLRKLDNSGLFRDDFGHGQDDAGTGRPRGAGGSAGGDRADDAGGEGTSRPQIGTLCRVFPARTAAAPGSLRKRQPRHRWKTIARGVGPLSRLARHAPIERPRRTGRFARR